MKEKKEDSSKVFNNEELRNVLIRNEEAGTVNTMVKENYQFQESQAKNKTADSISRYETCFSIPVFTHIIRGNIMEKILWIIVLLVLLSFLIFVGYTLYERKLFTNISTEQSTISTVEHTFPSVTFCIQRKAKHLHCDFDLSQQYPYGINPNKPCNRKAEDVVPTKEIVYPKNIYTIWENGDFEVACLISKNCKPSDIDLKYFKTTTNIRGKCMTWNYNGTYSNVNNQLEFVVSIKDRMYRKRLHSIEAIIHSSAIDGTFQTSSFRIATAQNYDINLSKNIFIRLPAKSNCTSKKGNDIFPKGYSLSTCFDSLYCIEVLKKCGDTFDFCRDFIPEYVQKKYEVNGTLSSISKCMSDFNDTIDLKKCPLPCNEEIYDYKISSSENDARENQFSVAFKYSYPHTYHVMKEINNYSWIELICLCAAISTFVIGPPVLLVFECFVYFILKVSNL